MCVCAFAYIDTNSNIFMISVYINIHETLVLAMHVCNYNLAMQQVFLFRTGICSAQPEHLFASVLYYWWRYGLTTHGTACPVELPRPWPMHARFTRFDYCFCIVKVLFWPM